jgi:hypothetical protein
MRAVYRMYMSTSIPESMFLGGFKGVLVFRIYAVPRIFFPCLPRVLSAPCIFSSRINFAIQKINM